MQSPWDYPDFDDHEVVHFVSDPGVRPSGDHRDSLHPSRAGAGGVRFWNYSSTSGALADALRLSRGMSFKNAMAGLPLAAARP
jgi:leucine dehydrogenase